MSDIAIMDVAKEFANSIKMTDIYQEYNLQKEKLKKQPELFEQVTEYRRKNFELQNAEDGDELFERMELFEQEYEKFRENPLVDDFLKAELALCRMMQEIYAYLTVEIDFE